MKRVILRFLRNKAIEIGKAWKKILIWVASYTIGWMLGELTIYLFGLDWITDSLVVVACVLCIVLLFIFPIIPLFKWLKENWERAKRETEYKN